jgi:hypothetical protein
MTYEIRGQKDMLDNCLNLKVTRQNAQKSLALATALFPNEEWIPKEP